MLWLAIIALVAAFFIWVFSPDLVSAFWATVATVVFGRVAVDLFERRTRNRRTRIDPRAIPNARERRQKDRRRRQDDNVWA
ncbi:MAG: hypothetical protein ACE5K1_04890 [Acidiferrobacterales bacterium]